MNIYDELIAEVGPEKINKLLLWERAANQNHWGKKINDAIFTRLTPVDNPQHHLDIVASVAVEMFDQAREYEAKCHK